MSIDTAAMNANTAVRPFHVDIPDEALADLRRRITAWRPPEREPVDDQSQGVQLATLQDLANYWATEYDWRSCQAKLNVLDQFMTSIDGLDVHFIHVRSAEQNALPLIVTHGWPGSIIEQLKIKDHRAAHQSHRTRWKRLGRIRRGDSVATGLRVLGQAPPSLGGVPSASRARAPP
jgi:Epoxide hydrolase N terminus